MAVAVAPNRSVRCLRPTWKHRLTCNFKMHDLHFLCRFCSVYCGWDSTHCATGNSLATLAMHVKLCHFQLTPKAERKTTTRTRRTQTCPS